MNAVVDAISSRYGVGMYFPTGLELLRRIEQRLLPWAWAVDGVAAVAAWS